MKLRDDVERAVEQRYKTIVVTDPDGEDGDWDPSISADPFYPPPRRWGSFMMAQRVPHTQIQVQVACAMRCTVVRSPETQVSGEPD